MHHPGSVRKCRHCNAPLPLHTAPNFHHCNRHPCILAAHPAVSWATKLAAGESAGLEAARPLLISAARKAGIALDDTRPDDSIDLACVTQGVLFAAVPHQTALPGPRDPAADSAFEAHLASVIALAFDPDAPLSAPTRFEVNDDFDDVRRTRELADDPPVLTACCIACKGQCCAQGVENMAFLTHRSIAYIRKGRPEATPQSLLDEYLSHLPQEQVENSCFYHGAMGCTLPRDLRADVCNRFQCRDRRNLEVRMHKTGARRVLAIGVHDDPQTTGTDTEGMPLRVRSLAGRTVVVTDEETYVVDDAPDQIGDPPDMT